MNNYFIIHGSFSSPFSNWIPYLRKEIVDKYNCYFLSNDGLEAGIDGVHLTKESHKRLAENLYEIIKKIFQ